MVILHRKVSRFIPTPSSGNMRHGLVGRASATEKVYEDRNVYDLGSSVQFSIYSSPVVTGDSACAPGALDGSDDPGKLSLRSKTLGAREA